MSHQSSVLTHGREELELREKELQQVHRLSCKMCKATAVPLGCGDLEARQWHLSALRVISASEFASQHFILSKALVDALQFAE